MKETIRMGQITLWALFVLLYAVGFFVIQQIPLPYTPLACLAILLVDLFLYSPIKAGTATLCRLEVTKMNTSHGFWYYGFLPPTYQKAVFLRLRLWKKRILRYAFFLLPSALLSLVGDRLYENNTHVFGLTCVLLARLLLTLSIVLIEISLLRYKAAWYILPLCQNAKQALKASKNLSVCCINDIVALTLQTPLASVGISTAAWVVSQTQRSRHVYIFRENTNTVTGITNA